MAEYNTHFSCPPPLPLKMFKGGGGNKKSSRYVRALCPLPPPLAECLVARLAESPWKEKKPGHIPDYAPVYIYTLIACLSVGLFVFNKRQNS